MIELAVIFVAMTVGAFVKGVTGTGLPQIAIPAMALFLGVEHAVVVMAVGNIATNSWMMWNYRSHLTAARALPVMAVAGTVGAVAGTFGLKLLDPRWLSLALGLAITMYLAFRLVKRQMVLSEAGAQRLAAPVGLAAGVFQGSTGISGPMLTMYLHSQRLARTAFITSITTMFLILAVVHMGALGALGMITSTRLMHGLISLIPIMAVLWVATKYADRFPARILDRWVMVLLVIFAVLLLRNAIVG